MTRADLTFHVLSTLRREKSPPLIRYSIIVCLIRRPRIPASQIAAEIGETTGYLGGPLDLCVRKGHVTRDDHGRYLATAEGEDPVRHLLDPNHVPA